MAKCSSHDVSNEDNSEVQLTLVLDPSKCSQLNDLPLFRSGWQEPQESHLTVTYFDGPGWPLAKANVSLWVEREGSRYRQHVERPTSRIGVAAVRKVRESPIAASRPALSGLAGQAAWGLMDGGPADKLEPFCRKRIQRTTRHMHLGEGGKITAAIDVGEMVANSIKSPVSELTLKLTSGPRDLLFELCLQIAQTMPLRISVETPARTALVLLPGQTPASRKANPLNLPRDATVDNVLAQIVQECLDHVSANEACVLESEDPEGVHQTRVAVRRFRSALRTFQALLPPEQFNWFNGELSCLGEQLGVARDWDVFSEDIVKPVASERLDDKAFQFLQNRINEHKTRSRQVVRGAIRSERHTNFLLRSSAWLAKSEWRNQPVSETSALLFGPVRVVADEKLTALHKPVWIAGRNFEKLSVNERHRLRIHVKRLRYATEFFSSIYPRKAVKRYCDRLAKLQDALGYLNDVAVAEELVRRICTDCTGEDLGHCRFAGGIVVGWHARAVADSERKLIRRVRTFVESTPFWLAS